MKSARVCAVLACLSVLTVPSLNAACNNSTVQGNWGFTGIGTIVLPTGPVPVAAVGSVHFDLNGDVTGEQDRSLGGDVLHKTFAGTYSLTRGCALTITVEVCDDNGVLDGQRAAGTNNNASEEEEHGKTDCSHFRAPAHCE